MKKNDYCQGEFLQRSNENSFKGYRLGAQATEDNR